MIRLYNVSQKLLSLDAGTVPGTAMLKTIQTEFNVEAVCVFQAGTSACDVVGTSHDQLQSKTRDAFIAARSINYQNANIVVRPLRAGATVTGAIGFEGLPDPEFTADPLAALIAAVLERNRAFQSAADAAANAQAETLRSAILDALAHEIKTPLAAILTAAGGLRAIGTMRPQQEELAELIESEASRLADLTSRLLRMARLDSEEIKPRLERVSVAKLTEKMVRRYAKLWDDRRFSLEVDAAQAEILADSELILLALSQLLENACRYSRQDAAILVKAALNDDIISITVQNEGTPIPAREQNRIFDRFYRGTGAWQAPGSGLGLYVARKILRAHGGDITVVDAGEQAAGFQLALPLAAREASVGTGQV